jgi:hypothetical protein
VVCFGHGVAMFCAVLLFSPQCAIACAAGTLTCNQMDFFKCSIAGVKYGSGETEIQRHLSGKDMDVPVGDQNPYREVGFNFLDT